LDRHEVLEQILTDDGKELTGRCGPAPRPRWPGPWTATTVTMSFDPTVDVAVRLGVDPREADRMVRGVVSLLHSTGSTVAGGRVRRGRAGGCDRSGFEKCVRHVARSLHTDGV
jgi:hypothetical protein